MIKTAGQRLEDHHSVGIEDWYAAFQEEINELRAALVERVPLSDEDAQRVLGLLMLPGIAVMRDVKRIEAAHGIAAHNIKES